MQVVTIDCETIEPTDQSKMNGSFNIVLTKKQQKYNRNEANKLA